MSLRLKSRHQSPPGGFQFKQPQTGWVRQSWDFRSLCVELQKHRMANSKFQLNTNLGAIMDEVDEANARRVMSIRGADIYVSSTEGSPPKQPAPRPAGGAGGGVNPLSGLKLLKDLLEGDPVDGEMANARASVCVTCPKNVKGDWKKFFTVPAAESIRLMIEARSGLKLSTFHDEELHICEPCSCPLKLKVHAKLETVLKHTAAEIMDQLPEFCWIKTRDATPNP